jgi:hypothetical protein
MLFQACKALKPLARLRVMVAGSRNLRGTKGKKLDLDVFRSPDTKLTAVLLLVAAY